MKKYLYLFQIVIVFLLVSNIAQSNNSGDLSFQPIVNRDIVLEAVSNKVIPFACYTGDILSGEFSLTNDGDLFVGDQTKYDNWMLGGIDFLILDAENYERWTNDLSANVFYERSAVVKLTWRVEIPYEGTWYIIYVNDSIFMKQIQSDIQHVSPTSFIFSMGVIALLGLASFSSLYWIIKKKNE